MFQSIILSIKAFLLLTFVCGVAYPLVVTLVAQVAFSDKANGSLVLDAKGNLIGSELIAQKFAAPRYFQSRPSNADYATVASGASHLSQSSETLVKAVKERAQKWGGSIEKLPADLIMTSGSGLDPHISFANSQAQLAGVASARQIPVEEVLKAVNAVAVSSEPIFGKGDERMINVLLLNLELDKGAQFP